MFKLVYFTLQNNILKTKSNAWRAVLWSFNLQHLLLTLCCKGPPPPSVGAVVSGVLLWSRSMNEFCWINQQWRRRTVWDFLLVFSQNYLPFSVQSAAPQAFVMVPLGKGGQAWESSSQEKEQESSPYSTMELRGRASYGDPADVS